MRILYISPDAFKIGEFVFARWDTAPQRVIGKDGTSYMIMRGKNMDVPQWLSFEDTMSSLEVAQKFPQYAFLYAG